MNHRMFLLFGRSAPYPALSYWENFFGGHITFWRITIYGANAMNWAVNISTRWGWLCFTLPVPARLRTNARGERIRDWYIYLSPNATPWAATFYMGPNRSERIRARIRKLNFGHGFSTDARRQELRLLNEKYAYLHISESELEKYCESEKESEQ